MISNPFSVWIFSLLFVSFTYAFSAEENFLLLDNTTDQTLLQLGPNVHERVSPASTFKIVLSLIGYNVGILKDRWTPVWNFQEGYVDYRKSWKAPQTPQSWIKDSCIWYSQTLAIELGMDTIKKYLMLLEYGNQDMSGGLTEAWLGSSLKISPEEQVKLIQRMIRKNLQINPKAIELTKSLLFLEELEGGWKLFGKRGLSSSSQVGWFVGWIEKGKNSLLFAYNIRAQKIDGGKMVPRVLELLLENKVI